MTETDITNELRNAANKLGQGEMAQVRDFSLFDSVSAFQMGHSRMDTGSSYRPLSQDIEHMQPCKSALEFVEFADALIMREDAWLQGSGIVQTILSSLKVESLLTRLNDSNQQEHIELKVQSWEDVANVYIIGLVRCASLIINLATAASQVIALDEEFHWNKHGFDFLDSLSFDKIQRALDAAGAFAKQEPAAAARLQLRGRFMAVLRAGIPKKPNNIDSCLQLFSILKDSHTEPSQETEKWFSEGVQTRAEIFCLPLPLRKETFADSISHFTNLLETLKELMVIHSIKRSADLLGLFLMHSNKQHCVLVRAMLKSMVGDEDILGNSYKWWALKDVQEISFPFYSEMDHKLLKKNELYTNFISEASMCYKDLLLAFCQNHCRQREVLMEALPLFDSLHVCAESLDTASLRMDLSRSINSPSGETMPGLEYSSWVYTRKLQVMIWIVLLTFKLDLFSLWEYPMGYFYASYLSRQLVGHVDRLRAYFEQHNLRVSEQDGHAYLVSLGLEMRALMELCNASRALHMAVAKLGLVEQPKLEFSSTDLLYGLRMQVFESVGYPPLPTLDQYLAEYEKMPTDFLVTLVKPTVTSALSILRTLAKVTGENEDYSLLKRSALSMLVAAGELSKAKKFGVDRKGHDYFPTPWTST